MDVVTLAAKLIDLVRRRRAGIGDGRVGQAFLDGRDVVPTRSVASFTADGVVRRLGTDLIQEGAEVGGVTRQAAPHPVALEHRIAEILVVLGRMCRQPGGKVPSRSPGGFIMRDPKHDGSAPVIPADEGREMIE
jgi:hypothetical protein